MKLMARLPAIAVTAVVAAGIAVIVWKMSPQSEDAAAANVRVPNLSSLAAAGKQAFDANCATCHGANGGGTDTGPPLIHDIYNPGHHGDGAFVMAAKQGVPRHHWSFGDMPPQPQVTDAMLAAIIRYVREVQIANGIRYKPHRM